MRIGDSCWHCSRIGKDEFAKPKEIKTALRHFSVMDKSGFYDISEIGNETDSRLTCIAQPYDKWKDVFKLGDLFYVDGAKPSESEDYYGQTANYRIADIGFGNIRIKLRLEKVAE